MTLTGKKLSEKCLRDSRTPMTPDEMWSYAVRNGLDEQTSVKGKTPWNTLGAQIYTDIKSNPDSVFRIYSTSPTRFFIKDMEPEQTEIPVEEEKDDSVLEKDLHKYLVAYVYSNENFRCCCKTINANKVNGKKKSKNKNMWVYPDIVGVHFPFDEQKKGVQDLLNVVNQNNVKVYSFEMKVQLTTANVRECYFQAISNSSWANEGYLVAKDISSDAREELRSLNNSFGIGVIKLDCEEPSQSEILFSSRVKEYMDAGMVNRLYDNTDFSKFVDSINEGLKIGRPLLETYDKVIDFEE